MSTESKERIKVLIENAQYVCLFIILVGMFMGTMYAFGASILVSIPLSFGLIFLLHFILNVLITLRKERRPSAASFNLGSGIWWGFYMVISLPISFYTMHMLNVEVVELGNARKIGKEKFEFIEIWKTQIASSVDKGFNNKVTATYTDFLAFKSNILSEDQVAQRNGLTASRVKNIHGETRYKIRENIVQAFAAKKDTLVSSISRCFTAYPTNALERLGKHNFKQQQVLDTLGVTLQNMGNLKKLQLQVEGVNFNVPSDLELQNQLDKVSLINRPWELFKKRPFSGFFFMVIVNLVILLPVLLSKRRKAPPSSDKINTVTTY
jgi:hypothetical protein